MMSQKDMVFRLWKICSDLTKMKLDLQEVANTLSNWQTERCEKGLVPEAQELIDSVSLAWHSITLAAAAEEIGRIHKRLETDMFINEV